MKKQSIKSVLWASVALTAFLMPAAEAGTVKQDTAATKSSDHAAASSGSSQGKSASGSQVAAKNAKGSDHGAAKAGAHWGYSGKGGPAHWGSLSKKNRLCANGAEQSPINFGASDFDGATVEPIDFDYRLSPVEFTNNGHTVQVNYAPGSSITVRGKRFELLQFHFHTPSEHAVNGRQAPLEMHLVHKSADGDLAVVGVMFEQGADNMALGEFWGLMPAKTDQTRRGKKTLINARDLLPYESGYYRYMGSLTTPPCSEGVHWHVMSEPVTASAKQISQIAQIMGANARPVQQIGRRMVLAPHAD